MNVECVVVGSLNTNCYILECNKKVIIIDPGDEFDVIQRRLRGRHLSAILITHEHEDHIGALDSILQCYEVPVYNKRNLKEGKVSIDGFNLEVIYTPGHTEDSISFYFYEYKLMFVGDFIFKGTIGRTDLPTGSISDMYQSLQKMYMYDERIKFFPGHGETTYLRDEKRENPYFIQVGR